jgi:DNA primase
MDLSEVTPAVERAARGTHSPRERTPAPAETTDEAAASVRVSVATLPRTASVTLERDAAIAARMASVSEADQQTVRAALWVIAGGAA